VADENLSLAPVDIVGIIQRQLRDLANYCDRPAEAVDPHVLLGYMGRIAEFAQRLPVPAGAHGASETPEGARAN
jgi:hypothetical protein